MIPKSIPKKGTLLALGGAVGGVSGKMIFNVIKISFGNDGLIGTVQSILMVVLTLGVFVYVLNKTTIRTKNVKNPIASFCSTVFQDKVADVHILLLVVMAAGGILGGFVGRTFSKRMRSPQVDILFRWMLVIMIAISCYNLYHYSNML